MVVVIIVVVVVAVVAVVAVVVAGSLSRRCWWLQLLRKHEN